MRVPAEQSHDIAQATQQINGLWALVGGIALGLLAWLANMLYKTAVADQVAGLKAELAKLHDLVQESRIAEAKRSEQLDQQQKTLDQILTRLEKRHD